MSSKTITVWNQKSSNTKSCNKSKNERSKVSLTVYPTMDENIPTLKDNQCQRSKPTLSIPSIRVISDKDVLGAKDDFVSQKFQRLSSSSSKNSHSYENSTRRHKPAELYVSSIKKHCPAGNGEIFVSSVDPKLIKTKKEITPVSGNSKRSLCHFGQNCRNSASCRVCLKKMDIARDFISEILNEQIIYDYSLKRHIPEKMINGYKNIPNKQMHPLENGVMLISNSNSAKNASCNGCCLHSLNNSVFILNQKGERVGEVYGSFSNIAPVAPSVNPVTHRQVSSAQKASDNKMLVTEDPCSLKLKAFDQRSIDPKGSKKVTGSSRKYVLDGEFGNAENEQFEGRDLYEDSFNFDTSFADPGYGSEKSEYSEDENIEGSNVVSCTQDRFITEPPDGSVITVDYIMTICPFITCDNIFYVNLIKNSRGLGLSVTGGVDCDTQWSGLIRIKKIFPQTPAALCHQLELNDILLEANGVPLTGLASHEALEVLRTSGALVKILSCRPTSDVFDKEENNSILNSSQCDVVTTSLTIPSQNNPLHHLIPSPSFSTYGDFEINITKVNGSLGFTLRKQDNSILGHTVRSLVKEPALSDGRIRPGDKLLSVNGTDMCGLSHEEAVKFLRTCPETVVLRLYRDAMQTPISPASPTETEFFPKPKQLRKEARDMLTDLAFRKQASSANISGSVNSEGAGSNRRRRLQKTPSPEINATSPERWDSLVRKSEENEQLNASKLSGSNNLTNGVSNGLENPYFQCNGLEMNKMDPDYRPKRPNFLDLTPQSSYSRKDKMTPPSYDPTYDILPELHSPQMKSLDSVPTLTSAQSDAPNFIRGESSYHSVNIGTLKGTNQELTNTISDNDINSYTKMPEIQKGLQKWKGIVFSPEEEINSQQPSSEELVQEIPETIKINLSRGWNSRLGFSLQPQNNKTVIIDVYSESLAARDGRLSVGDEIIKVNDQDVTNWETDNVIELLRKTRGKICLEIKKTTIN